MFHEFQKIYISLVKWRKFLMMLFKKKILETVNGGFSDSDKIRLKVMREVVKMLIKCTAIFIIKR